MPLVVRVRTDEEKDRARRFQVHHSYIQSVVDYVRSRWAPRGGFLKGVVEAQRDLKSFHKIQKQPCDALGPLTNHLTLSWASEVQLAFPHMFEPSLLKYSNAWAPVHAYYAMYMSVHAWFLAMGVANRPEDHTATLNMVANQVLQRGLFPQPWCITCHGCPELKEESYRRLPSEADVSEDFEILEAPTLDNFWPRFATLLRTTRQRRLVRHFNEWKRQRGRKLMYKREKRAVAKKVPPTTLFDFLWRLRVRANYRDVKAFIFSYVGDARQQEFHDAIVRLTSATCTLLQSLVVRYAGTEPYRAAYQEFERSHRTELPGVLDSLARRREILLDEAS